MCRRWWLIQNRNSSYRSQGSQSGFGQTTSFPNPPCSLSGGEDWIRSSRFFTCSCTHIALIANAFTSPLTLLWAIPPFGHTVPHQRRRYLEFDVVNNSFQVQPNFQPKRPHRRPPCRCPCVWLLHIVREHKRPYPSPRKRQDFTMERGLLGQSKHTRVVAPPCVAHGTTWPT